MMGDLVNELSREDRDTNKRAQCFFVTITLTDELEQHDSKCDRLSFETHKDNAKKS